MKNKLLRQFIMMSKLLVYGVSLQCVFLSLLFASDTEAQRIKTVYEVNIDISFDKAPLIEVLKTVENATPFRFSFIDSDISKNAMMELSIKQQNVGELLMQISRQTGLTFRQVNNNINVKKSASKRSQQTRSRW
ncbi:MAG: hypothetical protein HC819_01755 [Cyclobacteriaceae bacterium]|nr:hypothetical protein [Cyclobacteriaceae bacterium]